MPGDPEPPAEGSGERDISVHPPPGTITVTGFPPTISLGSEAERVGLSVADQVTLRDADLRKWMAETVMPAFRLANGLTLAVVAVLLVLDEIEIWFRVITPAERIITSQVIMALLGATTVQVGAIAYLIARYLFPSRRP